MVKQVTINPNVTVMGGSAKPHAVLPPKGKGRRGWESFDTIIIVKVGSKGYEQHFQVHRGILCNSSPEWKKKIEDGMLKDGDDQILDMRGESPTIFQHFHYWLYTDSLMETGNVKDICWTPLINLWIFGDVYKIPDLQDAAMNIMIDKQDLVFHLDKLNHVYKSTIQGSLLRNFFRDQFTLTVDLSDQVWWGEYRNEYPVDFLVDVIQRLHAICATQDAKKYDTDFFARHRHLYLFRKHHHRHRISDQQ